jgi:hypothetical protein
MKWVITITPRTDYNSVTPVPENGLLKKLEREGGKAKMTQRLFRGMTEVCERVPLKGWTREETQGKK